MKERGEQDRTLVERQGGEKDVFFKKGDWFEGHEQRPRGEVKLKL